jgi:hypothetical protein
VGPFYTIICNIGINAGQELDISMGALCALIQDVHSFLFSLYREVLVCNNHMQLKDELKISTCKQK